MRKLRPKSGRLSAGLSYFWDNARACSGSRRKSASAGEPSPGGPMPQWIDGLLTIATLGGIYAAARAVVLVAAVLHDGANRRYVRIIRARRRK
jgi:hypothetical protein